MKRTLTGLLFVFSGLLFACGGGNNNVLNNVEKQECKNCLQQKCKNEVDQCNSDTECVALSNCLEGCGDSGNCQTKCVQDHGRGLQGLQNLSNCADNNCPQECRTDDSNTNNGGNNNGGNNNGNVGGGEQGSCDACLQQNCSNEAQQCQANAECVSLVQCLDKCGDNDQTCANNCAAQHQQGLSDLQSLLQCADNNCKTVCYN